METTTNTTSAEEIKIRFDEGNPFNLGGFGPAVTLESIREELQKINSEPENSRSAWGRGVGEYAVELTDELEESTAWLQEKGGAAVVSMPEPEKALLGGAQSWHEYSWGGSSLIYDSDICARLATPSEQKRTRNGERNPNSREQWLDTQARALYQASRRVMRAMRHAENKTEG